MTNICAVCLKTEVHLINIGDGPTNNSNVRLETKLTECVAEIDWKSNYFICQTCVDNLECAYLFRMLCLHSDAVRRGTKTLCDTTSDKTVPVACFHCDKSFPHETALTGHIQEEHILKIDDEMDATNWEIDSNSCPDIPIHPTYTEVQSIVYKCESCNECFSLLEQLVEHADKAHQVDAYRECHMCSFCSENFATNADLKMHEKQQHLNKREYKCLMCSKTFNSYRHLWGHKLEVHTDPSSWTYVCEICNERFAIKAKYARHKRKHPGEKRFGCDLCDVRFTDRSNLKKHIQSHMRPAFRCKHCAKEFKDDQFLGIHLNRVHGVVNGKMFNKNIKHVCNVCSISFFAENTLRRHLETHQREMPYSCVVCDNSFADISSVELHMNEVHNVVVYKENE